MEQVYRKTYPILSFHVDPGGSARLTTLAHFFQEMAYQHAGQLGFGYRDLQKNSNLWVLSRMRIRVTRYPLWDEEVTMETWHRGMERLFGMRDFRVLDGAGNELALAGSAWLILDAETRRPVRSVDRAMQESRRDARVWDDPLEKIELPVDMEPVGQHMVVHSDLDVVGHVNNVKYMEWSIDAIHQGNGSGLVIREFEINFMHEARLGDIVLISGSAGRGDHGAGRLIHVAGHLQNVGKEVFRARLLLG